MSSTFCRRGVAFLVCSLTAVGCLAAGPAAVAATSAHTSVSQSANVSGSVAVTLTGGTTVTLPGILLPIGVGFDTGVQVGLISSVTNNTDATLVLSTGGSATVTLAPGASASVSALGSGSLVITATA
ncbi:hypothetical protein [Streptomyces sp. SAJ15]|uniref:hypothetical protein n=1 Tax=Streptomyces sp. SAJ15 TaxID=2011095 RepID=UPI00118502D0|nr:hypothetical protein [Streptomyces sp. SAJ15]